MKKILLITLIGIIYLQSCQAQQNAFGTLIIRDSVSLGNQWIKSWPNGGSGNGTDSAVLAGWGIKKQISGNQITLSADSNNIITKNQLENKVILDTTGVSSDSTVLVSKNYFLFSSDNLDFPSVDASSSSDLTITVTGASLGDMVSLGIPNSSITDNGMFMGWVSSANTVTIRFMNNDESAQNPSSGIFKVFVLKQF